MTAAAEAIVCAYYAAFNAGDLERFIRLLHPRVVHDISQGGREIGRPAFRRFMARMDGSYRETIVDLVIMTEPTGRRAAAEFTVLGAYLKTDKGLPPARGQRYKLPCGAFFEIKAGKVARISNHYNFKNWLAQVAKAPAARGARRTRRPRARR
ncbi:MAG: isopropylmalate/homocitrate/citramalate synthase [Alphaproteobacteria bacterium]|nr:isopropylmalate/homocitrate/citramalate synthase [Alphaproteobacteria bacterium]